MKRKARKRFGNRGFTLIELIVVIAIMAILVGVLAPNFLRYLQQARVARDTQLMNALHTAMQVAFADPAVPSEELDYLTTLNEGYGNGESASYIYDRAPAYWQIVAESLGYSDPMAMNAGIFDQISAEDPDDCYIRVRNRGYRDAVLGPVGHDERIWLFETAILVSSTGEYYAGVPADAQW